MFFEYALDPALLSSWDRTRFFLDSFGPWKGRFLAEYPRDWRRRVYTALSCPDVEKKRIEVRLKNLDSRIFSPRRDAQYDSHRSWMANAISEHRRHEFRAVIASDSSTDAFVLDGTQLDDRDGLWQVETGRLVSRKPDSIVAALHLLLQLSEQVMIIDPYFRPEKHEKRLPIAALCNQLPNIATVAIHFAERQQSYVHLMNMAERNLPQALPDGKKISLHCWKERENGARLHNRYLLTEIGGVQFGDSIEKGEDGQEDRLSILDESSRSSLWSQFLGATPSFDSAGPAREFVGGTPQRSRR